VTLSPAQHPDVVARDNSAAQNATTVAISVTYTPPDTADPLTILATRIINGATSSSRSPARPRQRC